MATRPSKPWWPQKKKTSWMSDVDLARGLGRELGRELGWGLRDPWETLLTRPYRSENLKDVEKTEPERA